jgi:HEAT repeat protein
VASLSPYDRGSLLGDLADVNHPAALGALLALQAAVSTEDVPEHVAWALENIHSSEALPHLARLLNEPGLRVRFRGVRGLGYSANNYPVGNVLDGPRPGGSMSQETLTNHPTLRAFEADPERYVSFWRNWYLSRSSTSSRDAGSR